VASAVPESRPSNTRGRQHFFIEHLIGRRGLSGPRLRYVTPLAQSRQQSRLDPFRELSKFVCNLGFQALPLSINFEVQHARSGKSALLATSHLARRCS
jgi:hypothetical protein